MVIIAKTGHLDQVPLCFVVRGPEKPVDIVANLRRLGPWKSMVCD
jgi:hypothetical protein